MVCPIMFSSTHHLKIMVRSRLELSATIPWSVSTKAWDRYSEVSSVAR